MERDERRGGGTQRLGDYLLLERIGEGPAGETYRALDRRDGRRVVLRRVAGDGPGAAALRREAALLSRLQRDGILRLLESGEAEGQPFNVLALEDGVSLDRLPAARRAALGQRSLMELLDPLLDALQAVHEAGFLHGDLSPRNILLHADGSPLLLDFAAAVELGAAGAAGVDGTPAAATPGFAAPERGDPARQGPASDLYALAAVIHWLIAGRPPAEGEPLAETAGGDKRFSPGFLRAVDAALAPEIGARPATAAEWRAALLAAEPAERPDVPSLAQLSGDLREDNGIDLPPADEVPPTVLLPAAERRSPVLRAADRAQDAAAATQRRRSGAGVLLALLLLLLGAGGAAAGWWGWNWYRDANKLDWLVDPQGSGDAETLAEAVARAPDGATIRIAPGLYRESLEIDRPLHLTAVESGEVVIQPADGSCLVLRAPSGSVSGLAFEGGNESEGGGPPCLVVHGGAVEIVGNRIGPWAGDGLLIAEGAAPLVRSNRFLDIAGSALVIGGDRLGRGGGVIEENEIARSGKSAVKVRAGADPTVRANRIAEAGQAGLLIAQGAKGLYGENEILASGASGIEVRGGAAPRVDGNRIEDAAQAGLFIHEGASGEYLENVILRSRLSGIVVTGGAAPTVTGNEVAEGAQHGLLVLGGAGGSFAGNSIHDNQGHGIVLGGGQAAELEENELTDNRKPQQRRLTQ